MVLQVKNKVMMTADRRKQFDQPFCGDSFIKFGSLRQIRRQIEKKGSRQPLKT